MPQLHYYTNKFVCVCYLQNSTMVVYLPSGKCNLDMYFHTIDEGLSTRRTPKLQLHRMKFKQQKYE